MGFYDELKEMSADLAFGIENQRTRFVQRKAEEDLRLSEKNLRAALAMANIGHWTMKTTTGEFFWSEELYRIAGRDPSLLSTTLQNHPTLYTPESWKRGQAAVEKIIEDGKPFELEMEMIRPDGTTRWVRSLGRARQDSMGQVTELYGTLQDITTWQPIKMNQGT